MGCHVLGILFMLDSLLEQTMLISMTLLGDTDSPVVPVMLCNPAKISAFSRECLDRSGWFISTSYRVSKSILLGTSLSLSSGSLRRPFCSLAFVSASLLRTLALTWSTPSPC